MRLVHRLLSGRHRRRRFGPAAAGTPSEVQTEILLKKPERKPSQVFDFDLYALKKIVGSVLNKDNPAKCGNDEKYQPQHQTKIKHLARLRVSGFHRKA
jgi:hypothetical protein